ncbi:DUF5794 domain-containing protein [Halegenticoccus tardaugens]|uniref:DUF5794 domain-containing protein n=1 Tax=Halegenticoccus tardaugens TaxID=2071624 RepID=UPI00100B0DDF|nr:DUF5794 domain-containing protein [Halegenticoccus tardaugens]
MSVSRHPIALGLERQVGGATRLLATVMALPLIDGIFPALVLAGALTVPFGIVETGLLIFGGSATVAVILAEMDGTPREQATSVLLLGAVLIPVAAVEAAFAPTIESLLTMAVFERFAGVVILAVAAKTASAQVGDYLPRPGVIIGLGLVASVDPSGAELVVNPDPVLVAKAAAAAGVGVGFALLVALLGPRLRGAVDIDRFRFGSSVALGMLALSVLGLMPTDAPVALGVLCVTAAFAFDLGGTDAGTSDAAAITDGGDGSDDGDGGDDGAAGDGRDAAETNRRGGPAAQLAADRGEEVAGSKSEQEYGYPGDDDSRAPWL